MPSLFLLALPLLAQAVELTPDESVKLRTMLEKSTNSHTSNLDRLSCTWKTLSPGTICSYTSPGDRDSFLWHGNAVAKILRRYVAPIYRADHVWVLEVRNLRCDELCRFD